MRDKMTRGLLPGRKRPVGRRGPMPRVCGARGRTVPARPVFFPIRVCRRPGMCYPEACTLAQAQKALDDLKAKRAEAQAKLKALSAAGDAAGKDLKAGYDAAMDSLGKAYEAVRKNLDK